MATAGQMGRNEWGMKKQQGKGSTLGLMPMP